MSKPRKRYRPKPVRAPSVIRASYIFNEVEAILDDIERGEILVDADDVVVRMTTVQGLKYHDVVPSLTLFQYALEQMAAEQNLTLPHRCFLDLGKVLATSDTIEERIITDCRNALAAWRRALPGIARATMDAIYHKQFDLMEQQEWVSSRISLSTACESEATLNRSTTSSTPTAASPPLWPPI